MKKILDSILELIGSTPLLRLHRLVQPGWAEVLVKLEFCNPGGSVKDRIALAMVEDAEARGILHRGDTIVEPTSGNTGIGLAMVAAVKGYKVILTMPETVSLEHRQLLTNYGAQIVLTSAHEGMAGALSAAQQLMERNHRYFMPQQFDNPANPEVHRHTTAREILEATDGQLDAIVIAIGTGGTITGVGEVLKKELPKVLVIGVEPARSPLLTAGRAGIHGISGIGANFIPKVLNRSLLDEILVVSDEDAYLTTSRLAQEEGLLAGTSSGANVHAALEVAQRLGAGKRVVTVLPDTGERYLSLAFELDTAVSIPSQEAGLEKVSRARRLK